MAERLTDEEIDTALAALEGWRRDGDALLKDALGHHAEIERTGEGIRFRLTTADAGGVTDRDVELAAHIDQVLDGGALDRG
jgi:4a-hydroxytetrahydrobiopterin dehydratase